MRKFLAVALAAAAALIGVEFVTRVFYPMDVLAYQDSLDPDLRFELKPGAEGMKNGVPIKINSQGMRDDREIPLDKKPDEFRVLVVGGHFTFGTGVALKDTYARELEGLVAPPKGKRTTIVNLSMYSYNLSQKMALLRAEGSEYRPDFVVFEVSGSDFAAPLPDPLIDLPRAKNFARSHSRFLRALMEGIFFSRLPGSGAPPSGDPLPAQVAELRDLLNRAVGVPSLVVYLPDYVDEQANQARVEKEFRDLSRGLGLPFHDLSEDLKEVPLEKRLVWPEHPFISALGHRAAALAVARRVNAILGRPAIPSKPVPPPAKSLRRLPSPLG